MNIYHYSSEPLYQHPSQHYQHCALLVDQTKDSLTHNQFEPISHNLINPLPNDSNCKVSEEQTQNTVIHNSEKKLTRKTNVDTSSFSIEERLVAAVWIHERKRTKTSISQIRHEFQQRFGREPPAKNTLLVWERKLFSTGSVCDAPRPGRPVNRRSHMDEVATSMRTAPALSLRARALALRLPRTTLRAILHKDLPQTLRNKVVPSKNLGKQQSKQRAKKQMKKPPQAERVSPSPCPSAPPPACPPPPPAPPPPALPAHDYT